MVVGEAGQIVTSSDGINWTTRSSGTTDNLRGVSNNGSNIIVAVGNSGTVVRSTNDETTWMVVNSGITETLLNLSYGNGTFAASGNNGTIATSGRWKHMGYRSKQYNQ